MGYSVVGTSIPNMQAMEKVTGVAEYTDDVRLRNPLRGKMLTSALPHARILYLDASRAEKLPGVKAVVTGQDLPDVKVGLFMKDEVALARDKVRYVGEPIAAVAAVDEETAMEALDLIRVEYEELPAVFDPIEAMQPGAPVIHENLDKYFATFRAVRYGNVCSRTIIAQGEVEKGFRESDHIFEDTFTTQIAHQCYLEPYGAVGVFDAAGKATIWACNKSVFGAQTQIAKALDLPGTKVRVIGTRIGGAYGGKKQPMVEPILLALSRKSGKPVKMMLSREEEFITGRPRHASKVTVKTGVKSDGTLVAREIKLIYDTGAYSDAGPGVVAFGCISGPGPYKIPHVRVEGYCVYTNKVVAGAYRGYGGPQVTFATESQMDMIAERLGLDPLEIRLKNAVENGDRAITGQVMHNVGLKDCLTRVGEAMGWKDYQPRENHGRGIAVAFQSSGMLSTSAIVKVHDDGTARVLVGAADVGQGSETILCQIAAEELGIPFKDVSIISADTDVTPYDWNTGASRVTHDVGNAVVLAAADAKKQLFEIAAERLEAQSGDLEARDGRIYVKGSFERGVPLAEVARSAHWMKKGPIIGRGSYYAEGSPYSAAALEGLPFKEAPTFIFVAQAVEVDVDSETGLTRITRAVSAHDVGKAINPKAIEGQVEGAFVQGLGYALSEELIVENGRVQNPGLADYRVPTTMGLPPIQTVIVEDYDASGPFGAKGVGEPALVATAPAIANAISDAVGLRIKDLPLSAERVWRTGVTCTTKTRRGTIV